MNGLSIHHRQRAGALISLMLVGVSFAAWLPDAIRGISGGASIIISGAILARVIGLSPSLLFSFLVWSIPVIILGTGIYTLAYLPGWAQHGLAFISPALAFIASLKETEQTNARPNFPLNSQTVFFLLLFIGAVGGSIASLLHMRTAVSILGPWSAVTPTFYVLFFLAALALIGIIRYARSATLALWMTGCSLFISASILFFIFPLGFGFDPYIHQAATTAIQDSGIISPKTPYYTGQYVLTVVLARLVSLPISTVDRLWLPILFSISFLPLVFLILRKKCTDPCTAIASFFSAWIILPEIISPTPWGAAYLIGACAMLTSVLFSSSTGKIHRAIPFLLAVATLCIHPIPGIIALGFTSLSYMRGGLSMGIGSLIVASLIPLAFLLQGALSGQLSVTLGLPSVGDVQSLFYPLSLDWLVQSRFTFPLDTLSLFSTLGQGALIALSVYGLLLMRKSPDTSKSSLLLLLGLGITLADYLMLRLFFSFPSLISYEQGDYAERLLLLSKTFLIVPFASGCYAALVHVSKKLSPAPFLSFLGMIGFAGVVVGLLYLSYPRNDAYMSFHGYNISAQDVAAVQSIDRDAGGMPYVVLANQVVSAAALKEFGFKRYVDDAVTGKRGQVFYYPIPTGSPLYAEFRAMLESPSSEITDGVMDRFGVELVYVVVNRYEPRAPNIMKQASAFADAQIQSQLEHLSIFRYTKTK